MKIRDGFVSNSSSSSFIITNTTGNIVDLVKFVSENPQIIEDYKSEYTWHSDVHWACQEEMIKSAMMHNEIWEPFEEKEIVFGDEDGTVIGRVFDYMLRDGGTSESFKWRFSESLR